MDKNNNSNNLTETIRNFVKRVFSIVNKEIDADNEAVEKMTQEIYIEALDSLVKKRIPQNEQEQFLKSMTANAESNKTAYLEQFSKLGSQQEIIQTITDQGGKLIADFLTKLNQKGALSDELLQEIFAKLNDPTSDIYADIAINSTQIQDLSQSKSLEELNQKLGESLQEKLIKHINAVLKMIDIAPKINVQETIQQILDIAISDTVENFVKKNIPQAEQQAKIEKFKQIAENQNLGEFNNFVKEISTEGEFARETVAQTNKVLATLINKLADDGDIPKEKMQELEQYLTEQSKTEPQSADAQSPQQASAYKERAQSY